MGCGASRDSGVSRNVENRTRKRARDFSELRRIDEHVLRTPSSATKSSQTLAEHLSSAATSDLEKIRAVYKWITANITYKIEDNYQGTAVFPIGTEFALDNEFGDISGGAAMAQRLCELIGIESKHIAGFSKGAGYDPTKPLTTDMRPNHSWNVVKLNNSWRFIDCTWGAGFVSDSKQFIKKETDFYFLTDPEVFIEDHFPLMNFDIDESKKWQLLSNPIDMLTFHRRVRRRESCYDHGVELISHCDALIQVDTEVTLKFKGIGDPLTNFSAGFMNPETNKKVNSECYTATVLDHRTNEVTVTARPPTSGTYWELRIYGTTERASDTSEGLVSYQLLAKKTLEHLTKFPDFGGFYGIRRSPERCGFGSDFCANRGFWIQAESGEQQLKFQIQRPVRASTNLRFAEDNDSDRTLVEHCLLEQTDKELTISVRMHRAGFYRLTMFCTDVNASETATTIPELANYLIQCKRPLDKPRPFPAVGNCQRHMVDWKCNPDGLIDVTEEAKLTFKGLGLPLTAFSANFVNPNSGEMHNSGSQVTTVLDHRTNEATVTARPPTIGTFWELQVFGTTEANSKTLDRLISYKVRSQKAVNLRSFPDFKGFYGFVRNPERSGFASDLRKQSFQLKASAGEVQLKLPIQQPINASSVLQFAGDNEALRRFSFIEVNMDVLQISIRMHRQGFYRLSLFCNDIGSDDKNVPLFANFLIECTNPMERAEQFPEVLKRALLERVTLECPRDGILPANSQIQFKMSSPTLKTVMVNQSVHHKVGSVFDFIVKTGSSGSEVNIFGAREESTVSFFGLYTFKIV